MAEEKSFTGGFVDGKYFVRIGRYSKNLFRNVAYTYHPSGYLHSYHTHDFYEMNYVLKGKCVNYVSGENLEMNEGDAILMHPGTFHSVYSENDSLVVNFLIRSEFLLSNMSSLNSDFPFGKFIDASKKDDYYRYILFTGGETSTDLCRKLIEQIEKDASGTAEGFLREEALFLLLASDLATKKTNQILSEQKGRESEKLHEAMMFYAYEHYDTITLEALSEKFGYSKSHICRIFRHYTGTTFHEILTDVKLSYACTYLRETNLPVQIIAQKVGFQSIEHFHRLFKKRFSISPLKYRSSPENIALNM
ncbi:MAG: helix-turn-helix domain-containing protein [Clostridia bacterium]|nr:helix-turn-helix domain-containing protein [Clostridia bacterium]